MLRIDAIVPGAVFRRQGSNARTVVAVRDGMVEYRIAGRHTLAPLKAQLVDFFAWAQAAEAAEVADRRV